MQHRQITATYLWPAASPFLAAHLLDGEACAIGSSSYSTPGRPHADKHLTHASRQPPFLVHAVCASSACWTPDAACSGAAALLACADWRHAERPLSGRAGGASRVRIILPVQTLKKAVNTQRPACMYHVALKHLPAGSTVGWHRICTRPLTTTSTASAGRKARL